MEIMNDARGTYDCGGCGNKYDNDKRRDEYRKSRLCYDAKEKSINHIISGGVKITFQTCLGNFYNNHVSDLLRLYNLFDRGIMPYPGGPLEQPAKFVEAMDLIGAVQSRLTREAQKSG